LFKAYSNTYELSIAKYDDVLELIKTCSFFANKTKHIIAMAQKVENEFNGTIPTTQKELISLAGVGTKTANVFLIEGRGANLMAVDTHVFRVSHRLGLSYKKTVEKTAVELEQTLMDDNMNIYHQAMVLFGRYKCKALNPICGDCELAIVCKSKARFKV
jgi:endonuclease-3